jgi:Cdc6-like AAA superfamily ATPase
MANRSLPMDTRPLAPDRLLEDDKRVLLEIAQTLAAIVKDNDDNPRDSNNERNSKNDTRTVPPRPPWATIDIHRTPRVLLIDGARGTGKTSLMLTLVRACNEGEDNVYYDKEKQAQRLFVGGPNSPRGCARYPAAGL